MDYVKRSGGRYGPYGREDRTEDDRSRISHPSIQLADLSCGNEINSRSSNWQLADCKSNTF